MNFLNVFGKKSYLNGKFQYEGMAYEVATGHNRCLKQVVDYEVDAVANEALVKKNKLVLDRPIADLYTQVRVIKIQWELLESNPPEIKFSKEDEEEFSMYKKNPVKAALDNKLILRGRLNVYSLMDLLEGPDRKKWKDVLWFDKMDKKNKEYWQQFMVFDFSVPECLILLKKEGGEIMDKLYYYNVSNNKPIDMQMGIEKYLGIVYKVKAFEGWQYALMKEPLNDGVTLRRMKHYLPQIFPKAAFDFSDFE